ncbi:amino acid ABC transporter permease [Sodalis sp. dw_96]|uniref:amino acid ABC transporter permease n=1 Tax=Sodalis sp. dw_96 TaxID=2719794 RepID=UPI0021046275|nr:amino acid ABC transporter permease [Sodalis sp. dw_96]
MTKYERNHIQHDELIIVPRKSNAKYLSIAVSLLIAIFLIDGVIFNTRFGWDVVAHYLFSPTILSGLVTTLWLTVVCMVLGIALGIILAVCRFSDISIVSKLARLYIWFFRGTPVLVQLIFWYNLAALFPSINLSVPFLDIVFFKFPTNSVITPFAAAILGLALNEGAYMAEIVRAGIASVDDGQEEAARALGMTRTRLMFRIVLPQAMRTIIPPTGNETIGMLKTTSLVSVISLSDLLYSAQGIYSRTFETIPLLLVSCFWYLLLTSFLSVMQSRIERYYGRGILSSAANKGRS